MLIEDEVPELPTPVSVVGDGVGRGLALTVRRGWSDAAVYCCCPVEDQLNCCIFPLTDGSAAPHVLLIFALFAAAAILPVVQKQHQLLVTLLLCNAAAMEVEYLDCNHINYHTILYSRTEFIC